MTGVLLFSLGIFFFAVNDALGKWLVGSYAVGELLLLRSVGALIVLGPMLWLTRPDLDIRDEWPLHLLRVACMAADSFAFYFATRTLPLADVMTFYLAAPLIITALSRPILGERVGAFRWGAVLVGFGGVLVALRPSGAAVSSTALIALFGSFMFACAITITRKLRRTHWLTLTTWQFVGAGLVGAVASPAVWIDAACARPRADVLGRHRVDGLLRLHHASLEPRAGVAARAVPICLHRLGRDPGLGGVRRHPDPAGADRLRHHRGERPRGLRARADPGPAVARRERGAGALKAPSSVALRARHLLPPAGEGSPGFPPTRRTPY